MLPEKVKSELSGIFMSKPELQLRYLVDKKTLFSGQKKTYQARRPIPPQASFRQPCSLNPRDEPT